MQIRHRFTAAILFGLETDSMKRCVEAAVEARADLRGGKLLGADMVGADMRGAKLEGSDLRIADMRGADMAGANMRGADMRGADFPGRNPSTGPVRPLG